MAHLWVRAESRDNEQRVGITPAGVADMIAKGHTVTVEDAPHRVIPTADYAAAGADIADQGNWPGAPRDAIMFGLKELPDDGRPLVHRHILFGHAFKGQSAGQRLLDRFAVGQGTLYDLEYLTDASGRRVAAFGYWAGFAGAGVSLLAWAAQTQGGICPPVTVYENSDAMVTQIRDALGGATPTAIVIGAMGRVGTGATELAEACGVAVTKWDMAETAHGGPFPEILDHDLFFNCILAGPNTPVFVPAEARTAARRLRVIGDIACDPDSDFNPIKVYDRVTGWDAPVIRVQDDPALDVMAIDNLPSLLPRESSADFAAQLLPHLLALDAMDAGVWARAKACFDAAMS